MSYLGFLCLFAHSGVKHILCCVLYVCFRLVCPILAVYLDCPFLVAPSVFSNVYVRHGHILSCGLKVYRKGRMRQKYQLHSGEIGAKEA